MSQTDSRKVAIIGCGFVGSASAFALMQSGLFSEMVLIDSNQDRAEGEALDIAHGIPFAHPMNIYAGTYDDIVDAAVIVVTAGAGQKPGETRLDLVKKNVAIFGTIMPEIKKRHCTGILLIVANPVDILTYVAVKTSGMPEERVIGSGTLLDSARLRYLLGEHLDVDPRSVHAWIIGEHGDSEFPVWSSADVSGIPIDRICEMRGHFNHEAKMKEIAEDVKNSAYTIIQKKKAMSGDEPFITIQDYATNLHSCFLINSRGDIVSQGYSEDDCIVTGNIFTDGLQKCWNNPAFNHRGHFLQYAYMFDYYM